MECRDAQFYLRLKRHAVPGSNELGADANASLDGHLATCPACAADARAAVSFDRAMANAMRSVPVPSGLREQLVSHVAAKQGAILRRKFYQAATALAAVLVIGLFSLAVVIHMRPGFDSEWVVRTDGEQHNNAKQATEGWLAAQDLPNELPLEFDYYLHMYHGIDSEKGVPVVIFRSPTDNGFARVYILRNDRFKLDGVRNVQESYASAEVIVGQGKSRGFTFVIVYTGGPNGLDQFLLTRNGAMPQASLRSERTLRLANVPL